MDAGGGDQVGDVVAHRRRAETTSLRGSETMAPRSKLPGRAPTIHRPRARRTGCRLILVLTESRSVSAYDSSFCRVASATASARVLTPSLV
jgi:hypothetical protein